MQFVTIKAQITYNNGLYLYSLHFIVCEYMPAAASLTGFGAIFAGKLGSVTSWDDLSVKTTFEFLWYSEPDCLSLNIFE